MDGHDRMSQVAGAASGRIRPVHSLTSRMCSLSPGGHDVRRDGWQERPFWWQGMGETSAPWSGAGVPASRSDQDWLDSYTDKSP